MSGRRIPSKLLVVVVALVAVLGASVTGGVVLAANGKSPRTTTTAAAVRTQQSRAAVASGPLSVVSTSPANGASSVSPGADVQIQFSDPVDVSGVDPVLSPSVPGVWEQPEPNELVFYPEQPLTPDASVTLSIDSAATPGGRLLSAPVTVSWTVATGSTLRLQQILASLGYLPLSFQPSTPVPVTLSAQVAAALAPPTGAFAWRWPDVPASLQALWQPGADTEMTQAAVMAFESASGLDPDGVAGPMVWAALIQAAVSGSPTSSNYSYVQVSESQPEQLVLWHNGTVALTTPANTGVPGAATPTGTWAVYARYLSTTMTGTDPDGVHYSDPGVPWVNYFYDGDAVHGFTRDEYGFPQSNGCVELPLGAAEAAFGLLYVGAMVTISA